MDDFDQFERSLAAALRSDADMSVARFEPATIASAAVASTRRRWLRIAQGFSVRPRSNRWPIAAAIVMGVLMVGALLPAMVGRPSPTPSAAPNASLPGIVPPSSTPSATAPDPSAFPRTTGVWIATGSMGAPRTGHTAVRLLDGRVLVVGGVDGDETDTSAELYDPNSGTWSATGNMLKFLEGFPPTLLQDGRVLVGDGDDPNSDDEARWNLGAEVYDPASGTWTATGKMITPTKGAAATLLRDGTVLVTGTDGAQLYDPDSGTWTATGKMTQRHGYHAAVLLADGRVLVAGGYVFDGIQESAQLYDPATGTWTATAPMSNDRQGINLTLLPDGQVLVMGGYGPSAGWPLPELYDPATGTWTPTGDFARPDGGYGSATVLPDGTVLVTGESDAELYDPGTGSWTTTGSMLRDHVSPLTQLLDGTVLVAGGQDCLEGACVTTGSAELYVPAGMSPPVGLPAAPDPTPIPTPTPTPTPVPPQAGPVPSGARQWEATVVNNSSRPATLFVAEEGSTGMTRLVGSVTPNVVPAGVTAEVTFRLPAKGVEGWWIFVNPGPDNGALLAGTDVPRAGEIRITADGQVGWLSP